MEFDLETLDYDGCELLKPEMVECSELLATRLERRIQKLVLWAPFSVQRCVSLFLRATFFPLRCRPLLRRETGPILVLIRWQGMIEVLWAPVLTHYQLFFQVTFLQMEMLLAAIRQKCRSTVLLSFST